MSLENLVKIRQLEQIAPDQQDISRLLEAARRSINDALRKQRNVNDYSGDLVSDTMANEAIQHATALVAKVQDGLAKSGK